MWRLSIEDDEANRTVVNLVRKEYSIGRAEENSVRLTERNVSRLHAILRRTSDGWVIEDLKSQTGSFVNERRVESLQPIDHRDKIRIGDYDISLLDSEREAEEASVDKQTETVPSAAEGDEQLDRHDRLVMVEGPNLGMQYPLTDKKVLLGRGEECDIAIQDTSVSRVHASLTRDEHGRFHISDQKSSNGVRVNGMEITKIPLYAGDVVELGDVHLQFVPKGSRFDENAVRATVQASAANSDANGSGKLWWALGALALVGVVIWVAPERRREATEETAAATPVVSEAALVDQAEALAAADDFDGAVALIRGLPATSAAKASSKYRAVVNSWADAQFQRVESVSDRATQQALLQRVVDFIDVDPNRRARAQAQIDTLNRPPEPDTSESLTTDVTPTSNIGASVPLANTAPQVTSAPLQPQVSVVAAAHPIYVPPVGKPQAPAAPAVVPAPAVVAPLPAVVPSAGPAAAPSTASTVANAKPATPAPGSAAPISVAKPLPVFTAAPNTAAPPAQPAPVAPAVKPSPSPSAPNAAPAPSAPTPSAPTPSVAKVPPPAPSAPAPSAQPPSAQPPSAQAPKPNPTPPAQSSPAAGAKQPTAPAQAAPPVVNWPGATP